MGLESEIKTLNMKVEELEENGKDKVEIEVGLEEITNLKNENEKLAHELKEVKLDLRIEKRELEKKTTLVTYIRERENKNKEKIEELEKEIVTLKSTVESLEKISVNAKEQEGKIASF